MRKLGVVLLAVAIAVGVRLGVAHVSGSWGELVGVLNLFAFLALGGALGESTSRARGLIAGLVGSIGLVVCVLLLFVLPPVLEYWAWINSVAEHEHVDAATASDHGDLFLARDVGVGGFWGYYRFTARHTAIVEDLPRPTKRLWLAETINWVKRAFYFLVATVAARMAFRRVAGRGWGELVELLPSPD